MSKGFDAIAEVTVDAPRAAVWAALTEPDKVRRYMHDTTLATDWKMGSPISWSGEWKGQAYQDKGTVLTVQPEELLSYTHWSPMGGTDDKPENYHTVTFRLDDVGGKTRLTLTQDNNPTQEAADTMAKENWSPMLEGLQRVAQD